MPTYRWLIADLLSGDVLEELPLSEVTWSRVVSRAGGFDASMPLRLTHRVSQPIPYALEVRRDSPRVYYPCGELTGTSAADGSGSGYTGTYTGTVSLGEASLLTGDADRAVRLGTAGTYGGYIAVPAAAFAPTNSDYTIEAWIRLDTLASESSIFRGHESTSAGKEIGLIVETDGRVRLSTDLTTWCAAPAGTIQAGQTHHVAATFDASTSTSRIYVDGAMVAESTAVGAYTGGTMTLGAAFGAVWFIAWNPRLRGVIDEAALYHAALSEERIVRHYEAGRGDLTFEQVDVPVATRSLIDPARRVIYVERDGQIKGGYIVWQAAGSTGDGSLRLGGEGLWSYFWRRLIRARKTYTAADQLTIARDLVNYAQAQAGGNIGIVVGSETCGVTRDRTYPAEERKPIGEAVEQLAAVQGGFDFAIESSWVDNLIVNTFVVDYPRRGRRTNLVFTLGAAGNIVDLAQTVDGGRTANRVDALGDGEGDAVPIATAADANLLTAYPLIDAAMSYSGVKTVSALDPHARADLATYRLPPETFEATIRSTDDIPLGAWIDGDEVQIQASDGWIDVDGWQRIVAYEVKVGAEGDEQIGLTFASTEATA